MRPREYLSYSQKALWKRSPEQYLDSYIRDRAKFTTREMAFGSIMAKALENEQESIDPALNAVMARLPKLDRPEYPIMTKLRLGREIIPIFSKLDSARDDLTAFKEYKTGKAPWTQKRVDNDAQITFYATAIYLHTNAIPWDIELVWVPTMDDQDANSGTGISATGEIKIFKTHRTMSQIINEMADMKRVWQEIGEACEKELI